jgi:hypothetical protein
MALSLRSNIYFDVQAHKKSPDAIMRQSLSFAFGLCYFSALSMFIAIRINPVSRNASLSSSKLVIIASNSGVEKNCFRRSFLGSIAILNRKKTLETFFLLPRLRRGRMKLILHDLSCGAINAAP